MATEKEEKGKIQVVTPLLLQQRWDTLQESPKYKDKAKYKLMEDMIASMEIMVFGAEHPEYEQQLADVDKCWTTVRNFLTRLIDDTTKAEENARKSVSNTLRTLENEANKVQKLEKERDEYWSKYYDVRKRCEELEKLLEEEKVRSTEAAARCKEAESTANELQAKLNEANTAIVKQMADFMSKYSASLNNTESINTESIAETATTDKTPSVSTDASATEETIPTATEAAVTENTDSSTPESATPDVTTEKSETASHKKRRGRKKE